MPATAFITAEEAITFSDPDHEMIGAEQSALYTTIVSAVCEVMEEYLRRAVVARSFTAESDGGGGKVFLKHTGSEGVMRVTKIVEKGATLFEAAVDATDESTLSGVYHEAYKGAGYVVRISGGASATWASGPKAVRITYTAGVAKDVAGVPENLKLCAKIAFRFFRKMGDQNFGKIVQGDSYIRPDKFPIQCLWMMNPYRLPGGA